MSPFWILLEIRVMEVMSGNNWSYKMCKAPVKIPPPKETTSSLITGRIPFLSPNQQCQNTEGKYSQTLFLK